MLAKKRQHRNTCQWGSLLEEHNVFLRSPKPLVRMVEVYVLAGLSICPLLLEGHSAEPRIIGSKSHIPFKALGTRCPGPSSEISSPGPTLIPVAFQKSGLM